jgi:hypothetical protein
MIASTAAISARIADDHSSGTLNCPEFRGTSGRTSDIAFRPELNPYTASAPSRSTVGSAKLPAKTNVDSNEVMIREEPLPVDDSEGVGAGFSQILEEGVICLGQPFGPLHERLEINWDGVRNAFAVTERDWNRVRC